MVPGTYVLKPNVDLFMKLEQLSNLPYGHPLFAPYVNRYYMRRHCRIVKLYSLLNKIPFQQCQENWHANGFLTFILNLSSLALCVRSEHSELHPKQPNDHQSTPRELLSVYLIYFHGC